MAKCSRCGNPVEFRYVDGRCIPLHLNGGCTDSTGSTATDYSGYHISQESTCFCTQCPRCGCEVFFIRHNGGSVWIDSPLGPPWNKHPCFDDSVGQGAKKGLLEEYKPSIACDRRLAEVDLVIGIAKSTRVELFKRFTDICFETGKLDTESIRLKHNAGFLLGKLCVCDKTKSVIYPLDDPSFVFSVYVGQPSDSDEVSCPKCGLLGHVPDIENHLRKAHDYKLRCPQCNRKIMPSRFLDHFRSSHGYRASFTNAEMIKCPECGSPISPRNLYRHLLRKHGIG